MTPQRQLVQGQRQEELPMETVQHRAGARAKPQQELQAAVQRRGQRWCKPYSNRSGGRQRGGGSRGGEGSRERAAAKAASGGEATKEGVWLTQGRGSEILADRRRAS